MLMQALEAPIKAEGWSQTEVARHLGVTPPRVFDIIRGKIGRLSSAP